MADVAGAGPPGFAEYLGRQVAFFDRFAAETDAWHRRNASYYAAITATARFYVEPGARVLEIGCGNGDVLAALRPAVGVGVDVSPAMVDLARRKHPHLRFEQAAAETLELRDGPFDYIVMSDLVGFLFDIHAALERLRPLCHGGTRVVLHWYNRLWQPLLALAERVGLKAPVALLNWTTPEDIVNLLYLAGFEVVQRKGHLLIPLALPGLAELANIWLVHTPGFRWLALTNWIVARPLAIPRTPGPPTVSVICPCRNEAGNIREVVRRLPRLGPYTELIFVEGHSRDGTLAECQAVAREHGDRPIRVLTQEGIGKGDAVRRGFEAANGDVLMILDADLSVPPEELPDFYHALVTGRGELINGSRLVYAMDAKAMRFLNLLGNRFFAQALSAILGQSIKDTLCGTKVLWRADYERIARVRREFGDVDPYGDFDLIFGAARLQLRIVEVPIRYRERTYGASNIRRFADGWRLLRMSLRAARRLVFIG
jgi:ubiquinone/menaquinone biosynthesis C-methylase UbiE